MGNYLGRKSLRGLARANRTADKAYDAIGRGASRASDATANLVRKASKMSDAFDQAAFGATGKAVRNASASVIKATRHARPRARETMGQINRRKGLVNKVYKPSEAGNTRMTRMGNNINFRDESVRPKRGGYMSNSRPPRGKPTVMNMREYGANADDQVYQGISKQPAFDYSKLSYDEIKPMGRSPRYTSKQVRAGKRVALGAAGGYAASQYFKSKNSNR